MGPIDFPETPVRKYHYSLRNDSEERSIHLLRGRVLKYRKDFGTDGYATTNDATTNDTTTNDATTNDATTNECYNEQIFSMISGCYNEKF
jgi:hypothetical protein